MSSFGLKLLQITVILFLSLTLVTSELGQEDPHFLQQAIADEHHQKSHLSKHLHHHHNLHHQHRRKHHRITKHLLKSLHKPKDDVEVLDSASDSTHDAKYKLTNFFKHSLAKDYYNKLANGRSNGNRNSEWDYHTYNVLTNTYGPPPPAPNQVPNGKGDDNTADVEFIGSGTSNRKPEVVNPLPKNGYDYIPPLLPQTTTTTTPAPTTTDRAFTRRVMPMTTAPPLVPHRRGYVTTITPKFYNNDNTTPTLMTFATDDPFESNNIPRYNATAWNASDMERRHICVQHRTITTPFKTREIRKRAIWKHVSVPCQPQTHANQMCTRVQLVHEPIVRDVIRHKSAQRVIYDCCSGWTRETPTSDSCMKPICSSRCQNGGVCSAPDTCTCPAGFTGRFCETDIDECKVNKPCFQNCINTVGSFYCSCREGFTLQPDQLSCKRNDWRRDDAFEARDMENDVEDEVDVRLHKIERSLENERIQTHELQKSLEATYNVVDTLKVRLTTLEKQQQDLNRLQTNLYATETRTNKLEGMLNLLMKCRNGPNAHCP